MSELQDILSGLPHIGPVNEPQSKSKTTAGIIVQKTAYSVSKAIFDFSPPTFKLDNAIAHWHAKNYKNNAGKLPDIHPLETRVGASLALLGYLNKTAEPGLTTVVAASGTLNVMEPVLSRHIDELRQHKVAFQVAAVDFDLNSGSLITDYGSVGRVARNLGVPLLSSSLALENDAYNTSVLTSVLAASESPAIHVYDGIRGTRQAFTAPAPVVPGDLPSASSLLDAFKVTNDFLGSKLAPFEYYGPAEPSTVYVTLGLPSVFAKAKSQEKVGVVNVRLYSPFLDQQFLKTIPDSTINIVVVGQTNALYKDVSAAVRLHYGFKGGPTVFSEVIGPLREELHVPETGPTAIVWDSDKASTAVAAGKLTALLPNGNTFTKFDNYVAGGVVASDVRLDFQNQFWDIEQADVAVVNFPNLLKSVDVAAGVKQGGKLVVAASSNEELNKIVPGQLKLNAMAKKLDVYRIDYSKIDTSSTQGRSLILAAQSAIWLLLGTDVDATTSHVVHANSWDTELIAATVNQIVTTLNEQAIVRIDDETLKEWNKVELSDKEKGTSYLTKPACSSFVSAAAVASSAEDKEPVPGESVDVSGNLGLKKRLVFREAFDEHNELRPDAPSKTFVAKVKQNERVTPDDYDRHIFHLELDITGTGLTYAIGEALGVHAPNNATDVLDFLESYGVDPEAVYGTPTTSQSGEPTFGYRTAYQIARDHLDLFGKVPKRFYETLAQSATDESQRQHLERLASPEGSEELKKRSEEGFENYVDVLNEFSSAKPSFDELIDMVAPLKRREYSIASSQKVHPNAVHLLIVVVDWVNAKGEKRYGQCSKYLADLPKNSEVVVSVKPSVMKLPKDPSTPIIMAGLGTGLAPFKAFLEEKMWQREQGLKIGGVYLFLGSRHQRQEYLYGELFEAYKSAGILTHIGAAFSRDQPEKIYIQHRILQAKEELVDAFVHKQGNFYLCGPTWPVPDISAALTDIVLAGASQSGASVNEATLIEELKEDERYILEVY